MSNNFLSHLNKQQIEAVTHINGPLLILAGAGSGKTRVITYRIAHLIYNGIPLSNILAVTFTNKAAEEMKNRIKRLLYLQSLGGMIISTFHSFSVQILRQYISKIGYKNNFCIYTETDKRSLIKKIINHNYTNLPDGFYMFCERKISYWKNNLLLPEDIKENDLKNERDFFAYEIYKNYQINLQSLNALDFDDLILLNYKLWKKNKDILEKCQDKLKYIMVDEFQDTNKAQFELIKLLADKYKNICVVGDDDQSIYSWRGADVTNILDFEKHFPDVKIVHLEQNYRSTNTILEAANYIISKNKNRKEKFLWSELGKGYAIDYLILYDENDEANFVVNKIIEIAQKFKLPLGDFAILYRSNSQSRLFEITLRKNRIPYQIFGGQNFFDRKEIKDIIAYLNVIINPDDDVNLLRIINCPKRGIGEKTIIKLINISHEYNISIFKLLQNNLNILDFDPKTKNNLIHFIQLILEYQDKFSNSNDYADVLKNLLADIKYHHELEIIYRKTEIVNSKWENVEEFINSLGRFQYDNPGKKLENFIDNISLSIDNIGNKTKTDEKNCVKLLTIHSSKGMEFPFVFLVGMEEEIFPHKKSLEEDKLDEERRLCYVAITRAKKHLVLTHPQFRFKNNKIKRSQPSRFINDIPERLLKRKIINERIQATI